MFIAYALIIANIAFIIKCWDLADMVRDAENKDKYYFHAMTSGAVLEYKGKYVTLDTTRIGFYYNICVTKPRHFVCHDNDTIVHGDIVLLKSKNVVYCNLVYLYDVRSIVIMDNVLINKYYDKIYIKYFKYSLGGVVCLELLLVILKNILNWMR